MLVLSNASLLHLLALTFAPWNRATSRCSSVPALHEILQVHGQVPFVLALAGDRLEILPLLPSFPERLMLNSMCVFRCICRV